MMRTASWKTFGELLAGLGGLVAAMFAVAVLVWIDIDHMEAANDADTEVRNELAMDAAVFEAMIDQEAGLRGFAITGDPRFLQAYQHSRARFDTALQRLTVLAADDPAEMRDRPHDIARQERLWTETVAEPTIEAVRTGYGALRQVWAGQVQIDAIRDDIAVLRDGEHKLLSEREVRQAKAFRGSRLKLVFGSSLALIFSLLIGGRSFWRLTAGRRDAEAAAAELCDALERAQAAERAKTIFLSNMSHEMRTPLNGVVGMAEALSRTPLEPGQRELLAIIRNSAGQLNGLIGDLLTLSRGERSEAAPSQPEPFHLGEAVRAIAAEHRAPARLKGLRLLAALPPEAELAVLGDAARLSQLLGCLMSNAIKFTDRGRVRLTLAPLGQDRYRFEVADTGIGFDEARKAELFQTFAQSDETATRRHGGAGLGLALARQLAADLGGQLDGRSTPGQGSVFTFDIYLPPAAPLTVAAAPAEAAPAEAGPLRVLVVDDNPTNRKMLELILELLGLDWVSVEDGRQAVDAFAAETFAAVLMDIQMPVMDGLQATREIRRLEREAGRAATPVIIVSANGEPGHIQAGRAAGAQLHLTKPVSAQALTDALNAVLTEPEAHAFAA
jgi:signal transduction histidine kinase/ActR/RegA family two-component response regulator